MTETTTTLLSGDKAIALPEQDRLGYASFSKNLAESITTLASSEGLVLAIYGPWGAGKTSVLNLVTYFLEQKPAEQQPIIVRFNPWWFSGNEDLTRRFFAQLRAVLGESHLLAENVADKIEDFADVAAQIPVPGAGIGAPLVRLFGTKHKDINDLKKKVAESLSKQTQKILVIIDDIDRLTSEEIRQIFRVVKAIGDFPNIIYLLAFDKNVAVKALEQLQNVSGEDYIEKIVQVPFELPLPDKTALRQVLFEKLDLLLTNTPEGLFDRIYWSNVYYEGIDHFITTPRDIVRLTNALRVTYSSSIKNEVNPVDFIAIETLRIFSPQAYDIIRRNPASFTGASGGGFNLNPVDDLRAFHEAWLQEIDPKERNAIKLLLQRLFPKLEAIWNNRYYGGDWLTTWRKKLRICSPDVFETYFRLGVPTGTLSNTEMLALLALSCDSEAFGQKLVEARQIGRSPARIQAILERLEDYTSEGIQIECIRPILQAFFNVGDTLISDEGIRSGLFEIRDEIRIRRIIFQLLQRLPQADRFPLLRQSMEAGQATSTIVGVVTSLGYEHGKHGDGQPTPEEERLITEEHLSELEALAVQKIRERQGQGTLSNIPQLPYVLYRWSEWGDEKDVKDWVTGIIQTDVGLIDFVVKFLQQGFTQSVTDVAGKSYYRLDPKGLEPFLNPSSIIDRVRSLAQQEGPTDRQKIALRQFAREYDLRLAGKDPSEPDW